MADQCSRLSSADRFSTGTADSSGMEDCYTGDRRRRFGALDFIRLQQQYESLVRYGGRYGVSTRKASPRTNETKVKARVESFRQDGEMEKLNLLTNEVHNLQKLIKDIKARGKNQSEEDSIRISYCDNLISDLKSVYVKRENLSKFTEERERLDSRNPLYNAKGKTGCISFEDKFNKISKLDENIAQLKQEISELERKIEDLREKLCLGKYCKKPTIKLDEKDTHKTDTKSEILLKSRQEEVVKCLQKKEKEALSTVMQDSEGKCKNGTRKRSDSMASGAMLYVGVMNWRRKSCNKPFCRSAVIVQFSSVGSDKDNKCLELKFKLNAYQEAQASISAESELIQKTRYLTYLQSKTGIDRESYEATINADNTDVEPEHIKEEKYLQYLEGIAKIDRKSCKKKIMRNALIDVDKDSNVFIFYKYIPSDHGKYNIFVTILPQGFSKSDISSALKNAKCGDGSSLETCISNITGEPDYDSAVSMVQRGSFNSKLRLYPISYYEDRVHRIQKKCKKECDVDIMEKAGEEYYQENNAGSVMSRVITICQNNVRKKNAEKSVNNELDIPEKPSEFSQYQAGDNTSLGLV